MGVQQRWVIVCDQCFTHDPKIFSRVSEDEMKSLARERGWRRVLIKSIAKKPSECKWLCPKCWDADDVD